MEGMGEIINRRELSERDGIGEQGIRSRIRSRELVRVRRGVYRDAEDPGVDGRHRQLVRATTPLLGPHSVLSHASAALLHGLPVEAGLLDRVWVIRSASHGGTSGVVAASDAHLTAEEVVECDGLRLTSVARTVVDLARTRPFDWGVAAADAALSAGLTKEALLMAALRATGFPGIVRGRAVVGFADARSESPGESRSRALMSLQGIPAPELQQDVHLDGRFVGRSDFMWRGLNTIGEFDGAVKYGDLLAGGRTAADVVMAEKAREERFRQAGWWVVRWGWADLATPDAFGRKLRRAFELAPR